MYLAAKGCVLGVDGGGTHTRAAMVGSDGRVLATIAATKGSNFQQVGLCGLKDLLWELLAPWLEELQRRPLCLSLGLAGAGRIDEQRRIAEYIAALGWADAVRVESDARTALAGAHADSAGIIVIAGTGSMVLGMGGDGKCVRAGGWGGLLGDEGSGYDIGLRAIKASLAAIDGCGGETSLVEILRRDLEMDDWGQIVPGVYGGQIDRTRIAALAPVALAAADAGDQVAADLVGRAGAELAARIAAVARRLQFTANIPLAYSGGVVSGSERLRKAIESSLNKEGIPVEMKPVRLPPVLGAVLLGWKKAECIVDADMIKNLERTASRPSLAP